MVQVAPDVVNYIYDKVGFHPTQAQEPIITSRKRFILVAGGEQAGKSMVASKYLLQECSKLMIRVCTGW